MINDRAFDAYLQCNIEQPESVTTLRRMFREVMDVRHETSSNVRLLRKETTLNLRQLLRDYLSLLGTL